MKRILLVTVALAVLSQFCGCGTQTKEVTEKKTTEERVIKDEGIIVK